MAREGVRKPRRLQSVSSNKSITCSGLHFLVDGRENLRYDFDMLENFQIWYNEGCHAQFLACIAAIITIAWIIYGGVFEDDGREPFYGP